MRLRKFDLVISDQFPQPESATWFSLFLESFEDTTIIVLIVAAVVSLAVGLYEDRQKGWIEGAAIIVAILVVAFVTSGNNFEKEVCLNQRHLFTTCFHFCVALGAIQKAECCER